VHTVELGIPTDHQSPMVYQYTATQQETDFGSVQSTLYWECQQLGTQDSSLPLNLTSVSGEGT
jgi:hypothetical protein